MRKAFFVLMLYATASTSSCNNAGDETREKNSTNQTNNSPTELTMPYTADYSSKFSIGDQKNAQRILKIFKNWDDNKLDQNRAEFADSVHFLADSYEFQGTTDSFFKISIGPRNSYKEIKTVVHAWIPVRSTDKNEDWVLLWSTAYMTSLSGKIDSIGYQDTWRFDKNGKIDYMLEYAQKPDLSRTQK